MRRARIAGALLCVAVLVASGCSDDGDAKADKSNRTTTTTVAGPGSTSTSGPGSTVPGYTTLPAVAVGQASPLGQNLFATVTEVESVTLKAQGPGDVAGPGALVTIEVRNDTAAPVNLDLFAVNASTGGVPASPNRAAGSALSGTLAAGQAKSGRYGFRVPAGANGPIVIDIQSSAAPNIVVVNAEV